MLHLAELMKSRPSVFQRSMAGKQMVMFFEKPSLRTRLTFEAGMTSLGGTAMFVDQSQSRLDARETLSDIAHNLERWVDVIVLRTFAQETIDGMARYASCRSSMHSAIWSIRARLWRITSLCRSGSEI